MTAPAAFVDGTASSASAVNAAINTAGGLYSVAKSLSFAAAASKSMDSCFNANAFANRLIIDITPSTAATIYLRMRAAGSDNSTASSYFTYGRLTYPAAEAKIGVNDTYWQIATNGGRIFITLDISQAFAALPTIITGSSYVATDHQHSTFGGDHNQSVSYDGFTVGTTAGTITGSIIVCGYRGDTA